MREEQISLPEESLMPNFRISPQIRAGIQEKFLSFSHRSSSPICPRTQSVSAAATLSLGRRGEITESSNPYLQSFATIIDGKSPIRKYHEKALEVAAVEIRKAQMNFSNNSIGTIMLYICKTDEDNKLGLASLFNS